MTVPPFPLRDRIAAALATACPRHSHCELMGPAVWAEVQPDMEQLRERAEQAEAALEAAEDLADRQRQDHRAELAEAENQIQELNAHLAVRDHALQLVSEHAETHDAAHAAFAEHFKDAATWTEET